jgi:hypothetical protein
MESLSARSDALVGFAFGEGKVAEVLAIAVQQIEGEEHKLVVA